MNSNNLTKNKYTKKAIKYAKRVVSGKIISSKLTQQACQRFLDDLERDDWEWYYEPKEVERFCTFAEILRQPFDTFANSTDDKFILIDWQIFAAANIFGFINKKGHRRFRDGLIFVPRRSGKSSFMGIMLWYLLLHGNVNHPRIFTTAADQKQAELVYELAELIAVNTPGFVSRYHCDFTKDNNLPAIRTKYNGSSGLVRTLVAGKNVQSKDGRGVDFAICDELHSLPTIRHKSLIQSMRDSMGGKANALMLKITTAGDISYPVGYPEYTYACDILRGNANEDRYFSLLYTLDNDDDPMDPQNWKKANPSYGITIEPEDFAMVAAKASVSSDRNDLFNFLTKRLNVWTEGVSTWINPKDIIEATDDIDCKKYIEDNTRCVIGADFSRKNDLTSYCITFDTSEGYRSVWKHWISRNELENNDVNRDIYHEWESTGAIHISSDPSKIDLDEVYESLLIDIGKYNVKAVVYDAQYAPGTIDRLEKKFKSVKFMSFGQNTKNYDPIMTEFEGLLRGKQWKMNEDIVAEWCLKNIAIRVNLQGVRSFKFPNRVNKDENRKIDPGVALLMSMAPYIHKEFEIKKKRNVGIVFI